MDDDAGKAESTGFGDCGSLGGESYAGSKDSVDTGGGDCGSPGTLVSPALNMLPPPIAADYDLERQQRLNALDPDETDEEELAKIETLRQHVLGALGITSADECPRTYSRSLASPASCALGAPSGGNTSGRPRCLSRCCAGTPLL